MKKQITINIDIMENLAWADVQASPAKGRDLCRQGHNLARSILETKAQPWNEWTFSTEVHPKNGESFSAFFREIGERLLRLATRRPPCKAEIVEIRRNPSGEYITGIKLRAFPFVHNPQKQSPLDKPGTWTIREISPSGRTKRIIGEVRATLFCHGDDLYDALPEPMPKNWVIEAEGGTVVAFDPENEGENFLRFDFKADPTPKRAAESLL